MADPSLSDDHAESERYQQVSRLFAALYELPHSERKRILDDSGTTADVLTQVEALLDGHGRARSFLAEPALGPGFTVDRAALPEGAGDFVGSRISRYQLTRVIASGGMGTVYEAMQENPSRTVAVKISMRGLASRSAMRRFDYEAQILARLRHPCIAQIYEAGIHRLGLDTGEGHAIPYFAMEYIPGARTITQFAAEEVLSTAQRLELFIRVCDAVHHGHQKGIIHRDLKPANILVDAAGEPKVIDFGVARATDSDITVTTLHTDVGQLIGTLQYMSPEQLAGPPEVSTDAATDQRDLDTRTDVYALGVVLFELLSGRLPYEVTRMSLPEAARIVRESLPARLTSINRTLAADLETITLKALEKDCDRRYQSALELAQDIHRYLRSEPIAARPPSAAYRMRRFIRRNRLAAAAAACTLSALLVGLLVATFSLAHAQQQRRLAESRTAELEQVAVFQASQLSDIDVAAMGSRFRNSILETRREALTALGQSDERIAESLRELDQALEGINFTTIALRSLDENIFERAIAVIRSDFADQPLIMAHLLHTVGITLDSLGLRDKAAAPLREALEIRQRMLGNDHPDTLESLHHLGAVLGRLHIHPEAGERLFAALEGRGRKLGDDHPDTLASMAALIRIRTLPAALLEAGITREDLYREALDGRRRILGDDHPDTLTSIGDMGRYFVGQARMALAEPYYRDAMEGRRRILGNDHPDTLTAISDMGVLLHLRYQSDEAEACYREALEGLRRVRGDDHPDTIAMIGNMGWMLDSRGRLAEAEVLHRESVEASRRTLGRHHPAAIAAVANLAGNLREQGRFDESERYLIDVIPDARHSLGEQAILTLHLAHGLGLTLQSQGRLDEADQILREILVRRRERLGDLNSATLNSMTSLGLLLQQMERFDEAEPLLREAMEGRRNFSREHSWHALKSMHDLAGLLVDMGRFEEAEHHLREALVGRREIFGDLHPDTAESMAALAQVLLGQATLDRAIEAESLLRECLAIRIELLDNTDLQARAAGMGGLRLTLNPVSQPIIDETLSMLGECLVAQAQLIAGLDPGAAVEGLREAEPLLVAGYEQSEAPGSVRSAEALQRLILLYEVWHDLEPHAGHNELGAQWRALLFGAP